MSSFGKRSVPKIGGSVGGFIALVICLVLIIIAACTAIFFIIRNDRNDARHRPRTRSADPERSWKKHKHHHSSGPSASSHYAYNNTAQPMPLSSPAHTPGNTPSRTWLASLAGMFKTDGGHGSHSRLPTSSSDTTVKQKPVSRGGWVQAGSGDEWDADDDERGNTFGRAMASKPDRIDLTNPSPAMSTVYSPSPRFGFNGAPADSPFRPPSSSTYSVPQYYPGRASDRDRNTTPGSPSRLSSGTASPVAMASAVPLRAASPERMAGLDMASPLQTQLQTQTRSPPKHIPKHINPERHMSAQTVQSIQSVDSVQSSVSGLSTRTFSGGTKFLEDI